MANAAAKSSIEMSLTVTLAESEVRALDALMGYGTDDFLKFFYAHMGEAYMKPNEAGLRALFKTLRPHCCDAISRVDAARRAFNKDDTP